jgi:xanthosine utilization system XapX-like protein
LHVFFSQLVTMNAFWFINVKIPSSFSVVAVALMALGLGGALPDAPEAAGAPLAQAIDKAQRVGLILGFNPQSPSLKPTRGTPESKKVQVSHLFV